MGDVTGQRPRVQTLDREAQVAAVQIRLHDREAVVGVLCGPDAGRRRPAAARPCPRELPAGVLARVEQLLRLEVHARGHGAGNEVAERDLAGDAFGRAETPEHLLAERMALYLALEPLGEIVDQQPALAGGDRALLARD